MTQRLILRLTVTLLSMTLLSACEHGIDMNGTVIAPPQVQQLFSAAAPGQLFVVATPPPGAGVLRDSDDVFCMPAATERAIAIRGFAFGCAEAGQVQVSAFAIPRTSEQIDCAGAGRVRGPSSTFAPDRFDPAEAVASGATITTVDTEGAGSCRDGRFSFTLTLAPLAAPSGR